MAEPNPNGANQYLPDPRQSLFLMAYLDPKSTTFSNAYKSAIEVGYGEEYAKNITGQMPAWLSETIKDTYLIAKAEENLQEFLEQNEDIKVKADITKFVSERLNKKKYSSRQEMTGKDGKDLPTPLLTGVIDVSSNDSSKKTS